MRSVPQPHRPKGTQGRQAVALLAIAVATACSGGVAPAGGNPGPDPQLQMTADEAVRFLNRATFGASPSETVRLRTMGPEAWIDDQIQRPPTLMIPVVTAGTTCILGYHSPDQIENCTDDEIDEADEPYKRHRAWWNAAIEGNDQLRQRTAYALSQILVVSERHEDLSDFSISIVDFNDRLVMGAFGSFRDLIEDVSRNAAMGVYLGMAKNRKADPVLNTRPDENFARELMQLFTVGLSMLNPDGTPIVDGNGDPIPTYDQLVIEETARALTGWNFQSEEPVNSSLDDFLDIDRFSGPMTPWPAFHDTGTKSVIGGMLIPANQGAEADLAAVLDALASHPNVGPFIGKQLIQRLVTSNPSPEYVARVSAVWDDNGSGIRGDLGAVVKAILLDEEALQGTGARPEFGMVREPVLRVTSMIKAFDGTGWRGGEPDEITDMIGQAPLGSPSVFNFYRPEYATIDLAAQGLVSPEMQITTHSGLANQSNALTRLIYETIAAEPDWFGPLLNLEPLRAAAANSNNLVRLLEQRLMGDRLPQPARAQLVQFIDGIDLFDPSEPEVPAGQARALEALTLVVHSPSFTVQK